MSEAKLGINYVYPLDSWTGRQHQQHRPRARAFWENSLGALEEFEIVLLKL